MGSLYVKECRACGSKPMTVETHTPHGIRYYVACRNGRCALDWPPRSMFKDEADAVRSWNEEGR